jgi:peptidoglycan/xylan/chitin deacetylase (PgdA/CDA1 family)
MTRLWPASVVAVIVCVLAAGASAEGRAAYRGSQRPVPILMYHVIARPPAGSAYPDLFVPRPEFAAQMGWLANHGYRAVTLDRVYAYWHERAALPRKPVVLTFDDGSASIRRNALPVLRKFRWPGVLNLKLDNMRARGGITPAQVRALVGAGWELDSHTISHPDLTALSPAALEREVEDSRWMLQRQFRVPARFFCYPSGRYNAAVLAAVRAAGYRGATTTRFGLGRPGELFTLARIRVDGGDGASQLKAKLRALGA